MAYATPTTTDFRMRYPAFADATATPDATVTWWLNYVNGKDVDQSWGSANGPEGHMAAAAGRMLRAGVKVAGSDMAGFAASGVTTFRSGSFQASFSEDAVKLAVSADWQTSSYGADYLAALYKEKGGTRVTLPGTACGNEGFNGFAGPLGYPAALFPC